MNQRLQQFLAAENISQAQFADTIEVARASVSHVLAGRNRPGYEFIKSIADHYPKLNLEWLISGKGKMYKQDSSAQAAPIVPQTTVQEQTKDIEDDDEYVNALFSPEKGNSAAQTQPKSPNSTQKSASNTSSKEAQPTAEQRTISRIVVFYSDNTYQELK